MLHDPLANALNNILNAEKVGKPECIVKPASTVIKNVLNILKQHNYIKSFEIIDNGKAGIIKIKLLGNVNKTGVIKPRFAIKKDEFEKFEKRYLPAKDFGIIILSTSKGMMTHYEAKEKELGGRLLAYCY